MDAKEIKVETGEGFPDENTKGEFYKNILNDTLYFKNESGNWEEKQIKPSVLSPVYYKRVNGEFVVQVVD